MFNRTNLRLTPKDSHVLEYGVSPLHAWIRFFEFALKVSYKSGIDKWQIRGPQDKEKVAARKKEIQHNLWEELGLNVEKPKANGTGSNNDGNTARRAFLHTDKFANALGFDQEILKNLYSILIAISSNFEIDASKLKSFCAQTAFLYIGKYSWYPMSATVHKVLAHGAHTQKEIVECQFDKCG